jgi:hypothetical protein
MTRNEALTDIETISRGGCNQPTSQEAITCADTQQAVRLLAHAYEHIRNRDRLYGDRRRSRLLGPPPASVPPS